MKLQVCVIVPVGDVPLVVLRVDDRGILRAVLKAAARAGDGHDLAQRQQGKLAQQLLLQMESGEQVI